MSTRSGAPATARRRSLAVDAHSGHRRARHRAARAGGGERARSPRASAWSADWIERRTGIRERRYAEPGERVSELAARAGAGALQRRRASSRARARSRARGDGGRGRDHARGRAARGARARRRARGGDRRRRGLQRASIAALALASAWIEAGHAEHVLVIGAEVLSRFIDRERPQHGAAVRRRRRRDRAVAARPTGGIGPFVLGSDGGAARGDPRHPRARRARDGRPRDVPARRLPAQRRTREVLERGGLGARGRRPVRLPPGQRAHPRGGGRAPRRAARARVRLHRPSSATRAPRACRSRSSAAVARGSAARPARASCSARSAPGSPGARRWSAWAARVSAAVAARGLRARHGRLARHRRGDRAARSPPTAGRSASTSAATRTAARRPSSASRRAGGRALALRADVDRARTSSSGRSQTLEQTLRPRARARQQRRRARRRARAVAAATPTGRR